MTVFGRFPLPALFMAVVAALPFCASALSVSGITPENHLGGRMASEGYARGKVVLIDTRDYLERGNVDFLRRMQAVWGAYKTKSFLLVGNHSGELKRKRIGAIIEKLGVTFPVYTSLSVEGVGEPPPGRILVIDPTSSKIVYSGEDDKAAAAAAAALVLSVRVPADSRQLAMYLDYEIENLPGRALLRLNELLKDKGRMAKLESDVPGSVEKYRAEMGRLASRAEVKQLSKLVAMAESVKDRDVASSASKRLTRQTLQSFIDKQKNLLESGDEKVVQEAKNSIADIQFSMATLGR